MRKFLCEYETVWSLEELEQFFKTESDDREYKTFAQWLAECMWWNNGSLTEILTDETPQAERSRAVTYYHVVCSDIEWDEYWLWATESHAKILRDEGYKVEICPKLGC